MSSEPEDLEVGDTVRFLLNDGFHFGVIKQIKPRLKKAVVDYGGKRRHVPLTELKPRPNRSTSNA
jgi:hypothetical protein